MTTLAMLSYIKSLSPYRGLPHMLRFGEDVATLLRMKDNFIITVTPPDGEIFSYNKNQMLPFYISEIFVLNFF